MVRNSLSLFDNFNQLTPYAVGFDRVFDQLQNYVENNSSSTGYPPYNIRKDGDFNFNIEMALAGFSKKDIEIEVADGVLTVRSVKENEEEVYKMYDVAVEQEKDWAKFLFKDGSMIGLNDKLLNQYVEYMANKRMVAIGLKPQYDQPRTNNPLPWTTHWLNSRGLQNAPQETEIESYIVGGIKQDVDTDSFKGFQL